MITVDADKLKEIEKRLSDYPKQAPSVLSRALNRAATNVKSNASKKAREIYQIKAQDVNKSFKITRASRNSLGATVVSSGGSIGLEKFKINVRDPSAKKPRVFKAAVKKQGSLRTILRGFVANISGVKVFQRTGKERLPIQRLFGPPVPQMVDNPEVRRFIEEQAVETFEKRLEHEIKRVLEGN
ncbi:MULTISPECIES: phage tail protein [Paenibacillus]|uniref:phage tail protein n=1 Tax=Paenibacillus TaxID=44249 RepID=UPI00119CCFEC|nr:phage tail protein [Paenibacillus sp. IHBB 10380]